MSVWRCRKCGYMADALWEGKCPSCRRFYRAYEVGIKSADQHGLTTLGASSTKAAAEEHLSTGDAGYDWVSDGGIIAGRVHLLGGFAGIGKTRKLFAIADYMAKTQGRVIYASGEESEDSLLATAKSLDIVNDRIIVLGNQKVVEEILELAKKIGAFLTIFDSAQEFISHDAEGQSGSTAQCKTIGKKIKDHCDKRKVCSIIVNQMTGEGGLKGGTELEHKCDTVHILAPPRDDDEHAPGFEAEGYVCLFNHSKNRGGVANRRAYYKMSDAGVLEHVPAKSKLIEFPRGLKR